MNIRSILVANEKRRRITLSCRVVAFVTLIWSTVGAQNPTRVSLDAAVLFELKTGFKDNGSLTAELLRDGYAALQSHSMINIQNFPTELNSTVDLELEQFRIFDGATQFIESTGGESHNLRSPDVLFYRGKIAGEDSSSVFLSISPVLVNGYIFGQKDRYFVSTEAGAIASRTNAQFQVNSLSSLPVRLDAKPFCETPDEPYTANQANILAPMTMREGEKYILDVALDGAFSYYQTMGSNTEAAIIYLLQMTAATSAIYEADFQAKLWVSYCRVWSTADPFDDSNDSQDQLSDFKDYWNANMRTIDRDLACKFASNGGGGRAYVDRLCSTNSDGSYSEHYSFCGNIRGSFPTPLNGGGDWWDVYVVAHEWGHTFGSPHTHCYDPPIDLCWAAEGGCFSGATACERGTIMSYCHQCTFNGISGTANIDPWFHQRTKDLVSNILWNRWFNTQCIDKTMDPCYVNWQAGPTGDGTQFRPFGKVEKGLRQVTPGGTIIIEPGIYSEIFTVSGSCILTRGSNSGVVVIGE